VQDETLCRGRGKSLKGEVARLLDKLKEAKHENARCR
jgi:hypothetical protein